MTVDEIHQAFSRADPDEWAYADVEASAMYLHDPRLTLSFAFDRRDDTELGEPWTSGYPAVWGGSVTVSFGGETVEKIAGMCVRGSAYLPMPDSAERRVVPDWKRGLFLLVSARAPIVSYGVGEFEALWSEFGFSTDD